MHGSRVIQVLTVVKQVCRSVVFRPWPASSGVGTVWVLGLSEESLARSNTPKELVKDAC